MSNNMSYDAGPIPATAASSTTQGAASSEAATLDPNSLIFHPRDADVLCGRGGAALRHPGNQTYRRLVNLNKGLYITCLKTEKLKISRSIVAAIREQNGRFLEKSTDQNAWYDIGDKKAVEKTSQALREGQPKLRQKIIEMGVAVSPNENEQVYADSNDKDSTTIPSGATTQMLQQHPQMFQPGFDPQRSNPTLSSNSLQQQHDNLQNQQMRLNTQQQVAPFAMTSSSSSMSNSQDLHAELLRRLSLHDLNQSISTANPSIQQQQQQQQSMSTNSIQNTFSQQSMNPMEQQLLEQQLLQQQQQLLYNQQQNRNQQRPPMTNSRASFARELGISESQLSIMSEFSSYGGSISGLCSMTNGSGPLNASGRSGLGSTTSLTDIQTLMNIDSSFRNALMGLPIGSVNTINAGDQASMDNTIATNGTNNSNGAYLNNNVMQQQQQQQRQFQQQNNYFAMGQNIPGVGVTNAPTYQQQVTATAPTPGMIASNGAAMGGVAMNSNSNNFDRRGVFAKMKYSRPPSVQSVSGVGVSQRNVPSGDPGGGQQQLLYQQQQQQQQQGGLASQTMHSTATTEDMPNFHFVDNNGMESTMSFISTLSNTMHSTANLASTTATGTLPNHNVAAGNMGNQALYDPNLMQKHQQQLLHQQQQQQQLLQQQQQQQQQQYNNTTPTFPTMNPPSGFTTYDTGFSKVVVETAKVIDHSSGAGRNSNSNAFNDAMSIGSRLSLMSGLSRISDTSYDNSIFSDLSKKIGNVSTRSMAMSEMSALEIQELNEDDDNDEAGEDQEVDVDDESAHGDLDNHGGETAPDVHRRI
jgi:hypothetical protein